MKNTIQEKRISNEKTPNSIRYNKILHEITEYMMRKKKHETSFLRWDQHCIMRKHHMSKIRLFMMRKQPWLRRFLERCITIHQIVIRCPQSIAQDILNVSVTGIFEVSKSESHLHNLHMTWIVGPQKLLMCETFTKDTHARTIHFKLSEALAERDLEVQTILFKFTSIGKEPLAKRQHYSSHCIAAASKQWPRSVLM